MACANEAPSSGSAHGRRQQILAETRALFDRNGVREAPVDDIARAVGVNRAIIYRHFSSKEELFAMILVGYLDEIAEAMRVADRSASDDPVERLRALAGAFLDYGAAFPAFADCAQSLLRRRGEDLLNEIREPVLLQLGTSMNRCLNQLVAVLECGRDSGQFAVDDPLLLANVLYNQALGGLNLVRLELTVRETVPGLPAVDHISFESVKTHIIRAAVAMARGGPQH